MKAQDTTALAEGIKEAVRVIYGDRFDRPVRLLEARTEETNKIPELAEAIRLIDSYNDFNGELVAEKLLKAHNEGLVMVASFGRENSPVLYVKPPYWTTQRSNGERTEEPEKIDIKKSLRALKTIFAEVLADEVGETSYNEMRFWWD